MIIEIAVLVMLTITDGITESHSGYAVMAKKSEEIAEKRLKPRSFYNHSLGCCHANIGCLAFWTRVWRALFSNTLA